MRLLAERGCRITVVPAQTTAEEVLNLNPDGIVLANGPGDPAVCDYAIQAIQKFMNTDIPLFGICLGFQLLALASGGKTSKMKFGHHGANHPVIDLATKSSHDYQSKSWILCRGSKVCLLAGKITHRSLFDQSLQGICSSTINPSLGFQGHPEASPGPHDIVELFDQFISFDGEEPNTCQNELISKVF